MKYTKRESRFNEKAVEAAKQANAITEPVRTWADWYDAGYLVRRDERANPLFKVEIRTYGSAYLAEFFGASQVIPHPCRKAARCVS